MNLVKNLMNNATTSAILSIITYIFYGAVLGISMTPSAFLLYKGLELLPLNSFLNVFLFTLLVGVSIYLFFIASLIVFGIVERILTIGFKTGKYSVNSGVFARWLIYSGLHNILRQMVLPYVAGTVWCKMFYKILGTKIGKNVFINTTGLHDAYLLELGDNVVLGGGSDITCHIFEGETLILGNIKIGNDVLISSNAYIMPGVEIGEHTNIGHAAYVRKNKKIPANSMILAIHGLPAKKVAELTSTK